jgi:AcrR family transcriptional regulator
MTTLTDEPAMTPAARRILDAANELYYDRGINSVGMDLVAEEAGTTKKTIYDRFGSKDGLVVAYLEARARRWQAHVITHLASVPSTGTDRVLAVVDALEAWMAAGTRGCGFINAYAELSTRSEGATRVVRDEKAWVRGLYADLLAEAGAATPEAIGRQLAMLHEGAIVQRTAGGSPQAFDDARQAMRGLIVPSGS